MLYVHMAGGGAGDATDDGINVLSGSGGFLLRIHSSGGSAAGPPQILVRRQRSLMGFRRKRIVHRRRCPILERLMWIGAGRWLLDVRLTDG